MKSVIACTLVFAFATSLVFAYGSERRPRGRRGHRNGKNRWDYGRKGQKEKPRRNWDEMNRYASGRVKSFENETPKKSDQDPYMFSNTWGNDIFGTWPDENDNSWGKSWYSSSDDDPDIYGGGDNGWNDFWDDDWHNIWDNFEISLDWDQDWDYDEEDLNEKDDDLPDLAWLDYDYIWNSEDSWIEDIYNSWRYDNQYGWVKEIDDGTSWNSQTTVAADTPHVAADTPHVAADTPHVAADTPHVAADTPHVAADTPHVAADTPHVAADTPHVAADTPHVAEYTQHGEPVEIANCTNLIGNAANLIQGQTDTNHTHSYSNDTENEPNVENQTNPQAVMSSPAPLVQSNVINASINITTLGEILKLMELNVKNLPKEEQYSLKTLRDLVDTISIADALFDADRSWVCDVIKSNQLLEILKTILEIDSEYLDSFKKPRSEDDVVTENGSTDAGVAGTDREKEKQPMDDTGIASGEEQRITEYPGVSKNGTNSWSPIIGGNVTAVGNETQMNDTVVKTEYGKPPILYVTTEDGDENSKAFSFNLVHAEAEKVPGKTSRGETEHSTKYSRKRSAHNFVKEPRTLPVYTGDSGDDGHIMNKTEARSMKSGNPVETGKIQLAEESLSKTGDSRAKSSDNGDSVVLNDAEMRMQEDIVNQIIYKRMFFSFLGKMCNVDLLPGDSE